MQVTIEQIYEFYLAHPECIGSVLVKTRFGYKEIEACGITALDSDVYEITTVCGKTLKTSPDHLMLSDSAKWVSTRDLNPGDSLYTETGQTKIVSVNKLDYTEDLYDIQVAEVHEFFANGLVSHNSTMLDALTFVLFGKPFRNINKANLCNSINGKASLVECNFRVDSKSYRIVRGIKPAIFEIWCDGTMLNQDASTRDYQRILEQQILRLNYKTFTQVVILGSASFVPFMQLPSAARREVIEDILDIRIFTYMNQILKEKSVATKEEISRIEDAVTLAREKVTAQKKLISTLTTARESTAEKLALKVAETLAEVSSASERSAEIRTQIADLMTAVAGERSVKSDLKRVNAAKYKLEARLDSINEQIKFISENSDCPACQQSIPHTHKETVISTASTTVASHTAEKNLLESCVEKLNLKLEHISELQSRISQLNIELSKVNSAIAVHNAQIAKLNAEIAEHQHDTTDIGLEKNKLKELAEAAVAMLEAKTNLSAQKNLQEVAGLLLRDTGIKTAIIREYLPVMNKLINRYLNTMDSYIHFELDESFNETIKSRFRDEFTYSSFSEGEKQKIDVALLFAWRQIAKMKNSVNTNLLILDEIFDSSLDANSVELLSVLLNDLSDTNIFVISHRGDSMADKFSNVIKFEKRHDYSVMVAE